MIVVLYVSDVHLYNFIVVYNILYDVWGNNFVLYFIWYLYLSFHFYQLLIYFFDWDLNFDFFWYLYYLFDWCLNNLFSNDFLLNDFFNGYLNIYINGYFNYFLYRDRDLSNDFYLLVGLWWYVVLLSNYFSLEDSFSNLFFFSLNDSFIDDSWFPCPLSHLMLFFIFYICFNDTWSSYLLLD